jgi:hypothetical protein
VSYEVDVGNIGSFTLSPGWVVTIWSSMPGEFAPGQWFRLAPQLDPDNSVGVSIVIGDTGNSFGRSGEAIWIGDDGHQNAAMTIKNVGVGIARITVNWLSTPSHH